MNKLAWLFAILVAVLHIVLAGAFAAQTPFLTPGRVFSQGGGPNGVETIDIGAPDELQHVVQAARIVRGEFFPVLKAGDPRLDFTYQSHQPPLFYSLAAGWMNATHNNSAPAFADFVLTRGTDETLRVLKQPDWAAIGSSKAQIQGQGFMLRMLNALIGGLGILGVFALALWSVNRTDVAIAAALFAALLPMNAALSGSVSNDPLLICLCTWACAYLVRGATDCGCWGVWLAAGFLTGLAFLTKTSALALVPVWFVAMWIGRGQKMIRPIAGIALAVTLGGVWWIRNMQVYGDPLAMGVFNEAFQGRSPLASDLIARLGAGTYWKAVAEITAYSFVGVFSYMDIYLPTTLYYTCFGILLLAVIGFFVGFRLEGSGFGEAKPALWIASALLGCVFLLFIQFNLKYYQGQARYLLPALGPLSSFLGMGVTFGRQKAVLPVAILALFMLALDAASLKELGPGFEARVLQQPQK